MLSFSQDSKWSVEVNYPFGTNIVNFAGASSYQGTIDVGTDFRTIRYKSVNFGASLNGSILRQDGEENTYKITAYTIQPRIFAELDWKFIRQLHPAIGIGYTFVDFNVSGLGFNGEDFSGLSETKEGLNINYSLTLDIKNNIFLQFQFDHLQVADDNDTTTRRFNVDINLIKLGVGYRF